MIVAYLILAHNRPDQLARLVSRLGESSPVLIHFDGRASQEEFEHARSAVAAIRSDVIFVRRIRCYWGDGGIMDATLELVRTLVGSQVAFDYAALLSGSDYPVMARGELRALLGKTPGREYIESFDLDAPNRWSTDEGLFQASARVRSRSIRFRSQVWKLPGTRTIPLGLRPFGGSQWWCLTRAFLVYAVAFTIDNPRFEAFFRRTFIPDESFMQTLISNSAFAGAVTGDNLTFAIWDRPPIFPATLGMEDLPAIRASGKPFARKFDPSADPALLDTIDRELLGHAKPGTPAVQPATRSADNIVG
jgi:hypothetical protein